MDLYIVTKVVRAFTYSFVILIRILFPLRHNIDFKKFYPYYSEINFQN